MAVVGMRISKEVDRLYSRLRRRDVFAALALGLGLSSLALATLLYWPDLLAGRQLLWALGFAALTAVPAILFAIVPWARSGGTAALVQTMHEQALVGASATSAIQLALGRVAAGSDAAVELAIAQGPESFSGIDTEPLQRIPKRYRSAAYGLLSIGLLSCGLSAAERWQRLAEAWQLGAPQAAAQRGMARLRSLDITLHYPAYLERDVEQLEGSDGELEVPAGTQVELRARLALAEKPEAAAILVEGLRVPLQISPEGLLSGRFLARRTGLYRFALTVDDEEVVERNGHQLTVLPDHPPKVLRVFPDEPLELERTSEVEFLVDGSDDHRIASATLITRMEGSSEEKRLALKLAKPNAAVRHQGVLDLEAMGMRPGDTLNWVIEMADNNDVTGPGTGRSRWHRIHLFDPAKRMDELLDELDRFVAHLADRLAPLLTRSESAQVWAKASLKTFEKGRKLAEKLSDERLESKSLGRAVTMVVKRLRQQARRYERGQASAAATEDRMERDLLFLDDLLSKRRLQQLARLHQQLQGERAALGRLVERYRQSADDDGLKEQILASIRAIRRRLKELGSKMARLEKRVGQQYINRDALEKRSVDGQLDKLEAMVRQGRMDEALAALDAMTQALGQVQKQVEGAAQRFGGKEWREALDKGNAIKEQMKGITDRQQRLRRAVQAMRRAARVRHLKKFGGLDKLRQKLQRKLAEARGELAQMTHLDDWLKQRVRATDELLQRGDKALAADGYLEALEILQRAQSRLESLGWLLNEPGLKRARAKRHQGRAMDRVGDAVDLLERLLPDEAELLSSAEKNRLRRSQDKQGDLSDRLGKLGKMMDELNGMAPMFGSEAMQALGKAQGASRGAAGSLGTADAAGADRAQGEVLSALDALQKQMAKGGGGAGGMPMPWGSGSGQSPGGRQRGNSGKNSGDRVKIPDADQGVPGAWRDEIIEAWGEGFAGPGKGAVDRYYRELVR